MSENDSKNLQWFYQVVLWGTIGVIAILVILAITLL